MVHYIRLNHFIREGGGYVGWGWDRVVGRKGCAYGMGRCGGVVRMEWSGEGWWGWSLTCERSPTDAKRVSLMVWLLQ